MVRSLLTALCALALLATVPAQEQRIDVSASVIPATPAPGQEVVIEVTIQIHEGWHVYGANETTSTPIELAVTDAAGLELPGEAELPEGTLHDTFGMESWWLQGRQMLRLKAKVPDDAAAGELSIAGRVDYMACTETFCDPPTSAAWTATLTVGAAEVGLTAKVDDFGDEDGTAPSGTDYFGQFFDGGTEVEFGAPKLDPEAARAGETVEVSIEVTPPAGYHLYGSGDENPVKLVVVEAGDLVAVGDNRLPEGNKHEVTETIVNYWLEDSFELAQSLKVPAGTEPGEIELQLRIDYLLCDETSCLPPASQDLTAKLTVEAGEARGEAAVEAGGAVEGDGDPTEPSEQGEATATPTKVPGFESLRALIGLAFIAGLLALLLPCTYPMIPITISFFTKQAESRGGSTFGLSLMYGLGIVLVYVLIGWIIGPPIVTFATHWITNLVIGAVFVLFACSLFGWITIEPPRFLMNAAGKASTKGGVVGVFLLGTTLAITSFTCTGPIVALILAASSHGGVLWTLVGMAVFGLTMAIPFVVLSMLPGRMKAMPRAGGWMNTLKVFLGFIELAAALKFISNADVQLNSGASWLPPSVFLWLWVAIFLGAAFYMLGGRLFTGLACAGFAVYCGYGALGGTYTDMVMTAFVPPPVESHQEPGDEPGPTVKPGKVVYTIIKDDYQKAFDTAKAQSKLLFVNFTGFT